MRFQALNNMADCAGFLTVWIARGLVVIVGSGVLFVAITLGLHQMLQDPGRTLHLQAFEVNYQDMKRNPRKQPVHPQDSNWDGALAGGALGYAYGSSLPFIGPVVGPVLGMVLGYRLDDQI